MTSARIEKAVNIGISADETQLRKDLRKADAAIRGMKAPVDALDRQFKLLNMQVKHFGTDSKEAKNAANKLNLAHEKQKKKIKGVNEELGRLGKNRQNDTKSQRKAAAAAEQARRDEAAAFQASRQAKLEAYKMSKREVEEATKAAKAKQLHVRAMRGMVDAFKAFIGPLVLVAAAWEGLKRSVALAAEFQQAEAKFRVFMGSAQASLKLLQQIRDLSSRAPVSFGAGQRSATTMLQFGVEAEKVYTSLERIAEVTGGNQQRMESLALAYGQVMAAGRLLGQENLQLINSGWSPLKQISEETGETMGELKKRMEEGGISSEEIAEALKRATEEGGKFNGLLAEMADTGAGKLVKIQTQMEKIGTSVGHIVLSFLEIVDLEEQLKDIEVIMGGWTSAMRELVGYLKEVKKYIPSLSGAGQDPEYLKNYFGTMGGDTESTYRLAGQFNSNLMGAPKFIAETMGVDEFTRYEKVVEALNKIDSIREKSEEKRTLYEQQALEMADKKLRLQKNVTDSDQKALKEAMEMDLKRFHSEEERLRLQLKYAEEVGQGFMSDKELEDLEKVKERLKEITAEKQKQKRIDEAFKGTADIESDIYDEVYGKDAERVKALFEQSVDGERKTLEVLLKHRAAYKDIYNASNKAAQEAARMMELRELELKALQDAKKAEEEKAAAAEEAKKKSEEAHKASKKYREDKAKQIAEERKNAKDAVKDAYAELRVLKARSMYTNGDEVARKAELRAKYTRMTAAEAEKIWKYEKAMSDLQEAMDNRKSLEEEADSINNPNKDFSTAMGRISAMQNAGLITNAVADERVRKLISETLGDPSYGTGAVSNVTKGSQGAYKALTQQTLDKAKEQIQIAREQKLLQKTLADRMKISNDLLKDLNDTKPVGLGP